MKRLLFLLTLAMQVGCASLRIGTVTGIGDVVINRLAVSEESKISCGDFIQTGPKSYAKLFVNGSKIELGSDTWLVLDADCTGFELKTGMVGFTAKKTLNISSGNYGFQVKRKGAGNIMLDGDNAMLRPIVGDIAFHNFTYTAKGIVRKGQEGVIDLVKDQFRVSPGSVSAVPVP